VKIYYAKGPIIIMGVLFPLFLWLAFQVGKGLIIREGVIPLIAITVFFTSSAITPVILPWETRQKTLEMLLARPITITRILMGDMLASTIFGVGFTILPVLYGLALGVSPQNYAALIGLVILAALEFSAMGVLFSAIPTDIPADAVMISSVIRLPLIFISGVFIPLVSLSFLLRSIALLSPLTYIADMIREMYGGEAYFPSIIDVLVSIAYTVMLVALSMRLHKATLTRRL